MATVGVGNPVVLAGSADEETVEVLDALVDPSG
jgi:hypothetical protein